MLTLPNLRWWSARSSGRGVSRFSQSLTDEQKQAIVRAANNGWTGAGIAEMAGQGKLGIAAFTVRADYVYIIIRQARLAAQRARLAAGQEINERYAEATDNIVADLLALAPRDGEESMKMKPLLDRLLEWGAGRDFKITIGRRVNYDEPCVMVSLGPVTGFGRTTNEAINDLADGLVAEGWSDDRDGEEPMDYTPIPADELAAPNFPEESEGP